MGKKFDRDTEAIKDAALRHAEEWAARAQDLAEQGYEWAAPKVEEAAQKARPYLDNVHEKVVDDYLPRIEEASKEARKAAAKDGTLMERAQRAGDATRKSLSKPVKKNHRFAKCLGWSLLGTAVAGAGYLLWRRSQPIEDPWAEEYWADLDADAQTTTEPAHKEEAGKDASNADKAGEKADETADKVKGAATQAKHKAKEAGESVKDTAKAVKDTVKDSFNNT